MKSQKMYLGIVILVIIIGGIVYLGNKGVSEKESSPIQQSDKKNNLSIVYYYGTECPHCQEMMKFLEENKVAEKVNFNKKEIWHNKDNAKEMMEKVGECGLNKDEVGVPFLYAKGKCFMGTPDVEEFFKKEAGI